PAFGSRRNHSMRKIALDLTRALLTFAVAASAANAQDNNTTIIRAAVLIDGRGVRIANAAVVVRGDKIAEVLVGDAAKAAAKPGSTVIDLGAATLMPGLIDGHVHINSYFNAAGRIHGRNDGDT